MVIINVRKQTQYKDIAIKYFQSKWANQNSMKVYEDAISRSIVTESPLPVWYLLEHSGKIVGCVGLITNDFISCGDLWPWLCALYIEEEFRGQNLGNLLISEIKREAYKIGFDKVYLCTDHVGYYEKLGFAYIGEGYHPWGETSRVYECALKEDM